MPSLARSERSEAGRDLWSVPEQGLRAMAYSAIQAPLSSLTQMVAPQCLPQVEFIQPPSPVEPLGAAWHAQQIGSGLGLALDMLALTYLTRGRARWAVSEWPRFEIAGCTKTRLAQNVLKQAGIGACYSGFLEPVRKGELAPEKQLRSRLGNACEGAVACATFSSCQYLARAPYWQKGALGKVLQNDVSRSFFCGLPAGYLSEPEPGSASAGLSKSRLENAYAFALAGATFAGAEKGLERPGKMRVLEAKVQELEKEIAVDPLTKLLNRRGLNMVLAKEIAAARREGSTVSLLFGDLDGFKAVNDKLGHREGDLVLHKVAQVLQANLREADTCGRLGGDEFLILLPKTSAQEAALLASRLEAAVKGRFAQDSLKVGISLGTATNVQGRKGLADFLEEADQNMYRNKQDRKNARDRKEDI